MHLGTLAAFFLVAYAATVSSAVLKKQGVKEATRGQVIFLGDSITDAWDSAGSGLDVFNEFYAPLGTVNTGVSGDRTSSIIDRITNDGMIDNLNGYLAVLKIGTNDLGGNVPEVEVVSNIGAILNLIKEKNPGCRILLLGILPRTGSEITTKIRSVNAQIATYADNSNTFFLDMEEKFSQELGVVDPELFTDGLHLTPKGYEVWAATMNPLFDQILNSPFTGKAVFFGDSITDGWNGQAVYNEKYAPLTTSNFGVGGHRTTDQIYRIVDEQVLNGHNAKIAVVKIGTNDLSGNIPEAEIAANIKTIIDLILERQPHVHILLLGILPRNGEEIATRAENVNAMIAMYDDGDRVRYLNMRDQFQVAIGEVIPDLFTDGLHLTSAGYEVWSETMTPLFEELISFK